MKLEHRQFVHSGKKTTLLEAIVKITGLSRQESSLVIQIGGAYLGKARCKEMDRSIKDGDWVQVFYRLPIQYEEVPFNSDWVLEDNPDFLVANKPAGLPTQGRRDSDTTAFYEILKKNCPGYMGLHHRLDQGTSGLMVFSRARDVNRSFSTLFSEKLIHKHYLALCAGKWPGKETLLMADHPIGRIPAQAGQFSSHGVMKSGKPAETIFELIGRDGELMMVKATPLTGRTHQIRVHAAFLGFPLLGDTLYRGPIISGGGMFLHAYALRWIKHGKLREGNYRVECPENWFSILPETLSKHFEEWRQQ